MREENLCVFPSFSAAPLRSFMHAYIFTYIITFYSYGHCILESGCERDALITYIFSLYFYIKVYISVYCPGDGVYPCALQNIQTHRKTRQIHTIYSNNIEKVCVRFVRVHICTLYNIYAVCVCRFIWLEGINTHSHTRAHTPYVIYADRWRVCVCVCTLYKIYIL